MRGGLVVLALTLGAGGCATLPDFIGDTETYGANPNMPVGASINMQRVRGAEASVEPLRPEPGNVWPSEITKTPTLQELERQGGGTAPAAPPADLTPFMPGHTQPRPAPGSDGYAAPPVSSSAPGPGGPGVSGPGVSGPGNVSTARAKPGRAPASTVTTTQGPAAVTSDGAGYKSVATPEGNAILVPNGNGTSTLIRPNGTIETVPSPK